MTQPHERVLDWQRRFDEESNKFLVRSLDTQLKARNWSWKRTLWLDQGNEGACTGFGLTHVLGTTPRRMLGLDNAFAQKRYYRARECDEWPGENYEGSSVLGAMDAAKKDGLIDSYYWSKTMEEINHAVSYIAPIECGINWYEGMDHPDSQGIVRVTGKIRGGHALEIGAINLTRGLLRLDNSWGKSWGLVGSVWIPMEDMDRLRSEQGEFAVARKKKL